MRDILIIFCVLLVLLLIISTLGGSIRPLESYDEVINMLPNLNEANEYMMSNDNQERFTFETTDVAETTPVDQQPVVQQQEQENFAENGIAGFDTADTFASF